jgi:hypothetical protein
MKLLQILFKSLALFSSFLINYLLFDIIFPFSSFFPFSIRRKVNPPTSEINYYLLICFVPFCLNLNLSSEQLPVEKNMEMSTRITTDHHFRGYNYSMLASQRNNTEYASANFAPAFQPSFTYSAPLKGIKTFFWGNFFLNNLTNRDSDFAILQNSPGGTEKFTSISDGLPSDYYPGRTRRYKERNNLTQYDGLFYGIYYEWNTIVGQWSVGTWMWNNVNRLGKYSWQEYFIWYEPPILKSLNPKLQFFLNTSFDSGGSSTTPLGITNGQNYAYYEMSHQFCKDCGIQITPRFQIGYVANNDNQNRRAGISNMIQSLKFSHNGFDLIFNAMYRPDPILYDTFDQNKSDSNLPNPSRQYGAENQAIKQQYSNNYPNSKELADYLFYQQTYQAIPKTIFFISTGYSWEF